MDLATILGFLAAALGLGGGVILEGGSLLAYVSESAALIIGGGTMGAILVAHPLKNVLLIPKLISFTIFSQKHDVAGLITMIGNFSNKARREGILSLEAELAKIDDDFLKLGIQLIVDGTEQALVREILETKISSIEARHHHHTKVFEDGGGFAPTMGIIGTVLGLISVLSNISDAAALAESIALAFIATLYGVSSANLIWLPMANKLKGRTQEEVLVKTIVVEGVLSIEAGDNPRLAMQKLKAFLPAHEADKIAVDK